PRTHVSRPLFQRTDGRLPVKTIIVIWSFQVIAARETEKAWFQARQELHQVRTVAVLPVLVSRRKQRNQTEPDCTWSAGGDHETIRRGGSQFSRLQCGRVFLPLR